MSKLGPNFIGTVGAFVVLALGPWCAGEEETEALTFEDDIIPLVDAYCVDCHDSDKAEADLDLLRFETTDMVLDSYAIWERIGKRLDANEMPPEKRDQPTDEDKATFKAWLATLQLTDGDCDRIASEESVSWFPGYVMSRRLNRHEYENTLSDLFGIELDVADNFPADGSGGEGFDNNGAALFLSAIQVEKYLDTADFAVETAFQQRPELGDDQGRPVREAAFQALNDFATRAWRRPAEAAEAGRLMTLFDRGQARGEEYETSLKLVFKAVLVSPNFLFLAEPQPEEPGVYALGGYPLASRLSYFLWASMPDEELFDLAREGRLNEPEVLKFQVQRMLRDPKAQALGDVFATQWLGITQLGVTTKPDLERFPEFDDEMLESMREEASLFFSYVAQSDRSLLELIDADYTFANAQLAGLYNLEGVTGDEMRQVPLADANRGGVLGMASILTMTSQPLRTSPVLRGKWVLEQLLGERIPPPPADVGELPDDDVQVDGLTFREQLEVHRKNPECASCHDKMDPIGFGLENFDPIGRWRDEQAGQPVDSEGVLPSGQSFSGPKELKDILLARKDDFARNLSRKMVGYALGRSLTRYDQCIVDDCMVALKENDYRASTLFTEIILSFQFRHRYSGGES